MIKDWKNFNLIKENINENYFIDDKELEDYIDDNFYFLHDNKVNTYLFKNKFYYIDDTNWIRDDIKIGEELNPSIAIGIYSGLDSKLNNDLLKSIKVTLKKIKVFCKIKYKLKLETIILNPEADFYDYQDFFNEKFSKDNETDPLNRVSIDGSFISYKDERSVLLSDKLVVLLFDKNKIKITPLMFAKFYKLRDYDLNEKGELCADLEIEQIASILYNDYGVYKHNTSYVTEKVLEFLNENFKNNFKQINNLTVRIDFNPETMIEEYDEPDTKYWGTSWGNNLYDSSLINFLLDYLIIWNGELDTKDVYDND